MLGYKMRRNVRKVYTGILRIFNDKNASNLNKKIVRDNPSAAFTSNFHSVGRTCLYTQGLSKNFKHFPSIYKRLCFLNKSQIRLYSSNESGGLPKLTPNLPQDIWPGIFAPFSNLFLTYLVIKPHIDSNFDLREFLQASKQVVQIVSHKLADSDIDGLADMVTTDVLQEIKQNLPKFSVSQRQELAIRSDDIFFSSTATMDLNYDRNQDKKYLSITTVHHSLKDLKEFSRLQENTNPFNMQNPGQNFFQQVKIDDSKSHIMNYKFTREYSSDSAGDWLLSGVNHYRKNQLIGLPF